MPSADSCPAVRVPCGPLSPDAETRCRSPRVSSTAFPTHLPGLQPPPLVDMGFAASCQLARRRLPHYPVSVRQVVGLLHASFRPRLTAAPLRFASPSPPPGWAGDFHPQAVEHAWHTRRGPRHRGRGPQKSRRAPCAGITQIRFVGSAAKRPPSQPGSGPSSPGGCANEYSSGTRATSTRPDGRWSETSLGLNWV